VVVLLIGTNNIGIGHQEGSLAMIGIVRLAGEIHLRLPDAKILLLGLLPRHDQFDSQVTECNRTLSEMAKEDYVVYFDPGAEMPPEDFPDNLHPGPDGYRHLAKLLAPKIRELYGMGTTTVP
jgi:lysophospholipase L1-like esterase